jgi:hypothetical protein
MRIPTSTTEVLQIEDREDDYYVALFILLMGVKTRERIVHYYVQYSTCQNKMPQTSAKAP